MVFRNPKILELFPVPRDHRGHDTRLDEAVELCNKGQLSAALVSLVKLIDEGCDEANYYAGRIYEEGGNGVEQNLANAIFYYEKSVAMYGSVEGTLALGRLHYFGIGVTQDYQKAFELLSRITDHGVAQMMLGQMYAFGHGVKQDFGIAREYFQKAVDQEYVFPLSALSALEWQSGNYWKSVVLRIKAIWLATRITRSNPHDWRLRRS